MEGALSMPDNQKANTDTSKRSQEALITNPKSLEDKKGSRAKRSGYNHPAAKSSNIDMFAMPDGGISHKEENAMMKKICPFGHKDAAAGLDSDKTTFSNWIGDKKDQTTKPVYFPPQVTDPITHSAICEDHTNRDRTLIQGAAGVGSERLTKMKATWITEKHGQHAPTQSKMHSSKNDLIAHTGDEPAKSKKGLRQFHDTTAHKDSVHIKHKAAHPEPMKPEDVNKWFKMKQVRIRGGEFIYNVAGHEDLLPAATEAYTKADRPPSRSHRAENDKRWLPNFFRKVDDARRTLKSEESEDMAFIMGHSDEPPLGLSSRQSMTSMYSDEGFFRPPPQSSTAMRSASARILPREEGDSRRELTSRYRSITPPPGYGYTPPGSYAPSESNYSMRSVTPPRRFSPPARSQGSGSVYSVDSKTRQVWSSPNQVTMGSRGGEMYC